MSKSPETGWWRRNRWGLVALIPALVVLLALSTQDLKAVYDHEPRTAVAARSDGWYELRGTRIRLVALGPANDLKTYEGTSFTPPPHVTIWRVTIEFLIVEPRKPYPDLPFSTPAPSKPQPTTAQPTTAQPTTAQPTAPPSTAIPSAGTRSAEQPSPTDLAATTEAPEPPESDLGACEITLLDADGRSYGDGPDELLKGAADVVSHGCMAGYDEPDPLRYVNDIYFALPTGAVPRSVRIYDILSVPNYVGLTPGG